MTYSSGFQPPQRPPKRNDGAIGCLFVLWFGICGVLGLGVVGVLVWALIKVVEWLTTK